ncbi:MAG: hypothetical protein DWG83_01680 [Chloroflexi bacterium]|nr:hypothetical protein [Chloroflexota bacterium]MDA1240656.1 hypothetical protein [Chloroflexota bacterium]MQC19267.1 hypothetical protein [Chloroflexota bacterium]
MADGVRAAEGEQAEVVPPARRYPASSDFPTGPAIGEAFPDVVLRDQHGETVDIHAARDGRAAFVLFHRSARW